MYVYQLGGLKTCKSDKFVTLIYTITTIIYRICEIKCKLLRERKEKDKHNIMETEEVQKNEENGIRHDMNILR
jgi:hypothetical protein